MTSDFEKKLFEEMKNCWDNIDEAHTDIPRGYFKHGFLTGGRWAHKDAQFEIEKLEDENLKLKVLIDWLDSGIDDITSDEERPQVVHLRTRIEETLASLEREK